MKITLFIKDFKSNHALQRLEKAVANLRLRQTDRFNLLTILNELVTNSLEHGLLCLESSQKSDPSGFSAFYELRTQRIEQWQDGRIDVHITHDISGSNEKVLILIRDTGQGFDTGILDDSVSNNKSLSGRGINIARELCSSLLYSEKGNEVRAVYVPE